MSLHTDTHTYTNLRPPLKPWDRESKLNRKKEDESKGCSSLPLLNFSTFVFLENALLTKKYPEINVHTCLSPVFVKYIFSWLLKTCFFFFFKSIFSCNFSKTPEELNLNLQSRRLEGFFICFVLFFEWVKR